MTNTDIVQAQVDAYNAQDLERFLAFYAEDAIIATIDGAILQNGRAEIRERFGALFLQFPHNRCWITSRFAVGEHVIDHEQGERSPGGDSFDLAAIYTLRDGLISRLVMAR
jgi:uncharacterized protein (TIGR02246 family)